MEMKSPALLVSYHEYDDFECDEPDLTFWLKQRARRNQLSGASRVFVICEPGTERVIGYYSLSAGSVERSQAPRALRQNMPDPLPVMILGRLAIDSEWTGKGLGTDLLQDAVMRCQYVYENIGIVAILVHAISDAARDFYIHHGFKPSPLTEHTLFLPMPKALS
ncbi:GNAT family N-acetyltransferase [Salmonella enterica]|nr:GNAT family N-acetyltransferase [Salmonella enterica]EJT3914024.1 GNAT family N-acetyltransferase [Salmonella enterica]ELL1509966.1 GNAT family N-acetyltransferase [Salmonella enterica]